MTMIYSNPARENDEHVLPDVEVFEAHIMRCPVCEAEYPETDYGGTSYRNTDSETTCCHGEPLKQSEWAWWYWFCAPGCLPDSDPNGPFDTKAEAIADAQSADEWSGTQCDTDPSGCWIDDITSEHVNATTGERTMSHPLPPCVLAMRCYCAGHARGNPASAPCDTSEVQS